MPDTIDVLSPLAHVAVREATPALRPQSLEGLRPGILENRKANARLLMQTMVERLGERQQTGRRAALRLNRRRPAQRSRFRPDRFL